MPAASARKSCLSLECVCQHAGGRSSTHLLFDKGGGGGRVVTGQKNPLRGKTDTEMERSNLLESKNIKEEDMVTSKPK